MRVLLVVSAVLLVFAVPANAGLIGRVATKPARYYEVRAPEQPVGTILVLHGGGWQWVGPDDVRYEEGEAARFRSYGWRTVNVDYRAGYRSLRDVVAWYDWVRVNFAGPVCVFGRSAGAHLGLMLASVRRPDCVIGHGAITDLEEVHGNPDAALLRRDFIEPSFGTQVREYSPVRHPALKGVPVLLATAATDPLGGCRQLWDYNQVRPATRIYCLGSGSASFMHADVDAGTLAAEYARERALLRSAASQARR